MPFIRDMEQCGFFGCLNPQHEELTFDTSVVLPEITPPMVIPICLFHESLVIGPPELYSIGLTYRNELEIRPIPAKPAE